MAEEQDSAGEKSEEPSASRIEEFRKKGEVASSKELNSVLLLAASLLTLGLSLAFIYDTLSGYIHWLYALDINNAYSSENMRRLLMETIFVAAKCVGPLFLVSICVGVISTVAQIGFLFSPEVLEFKPDRINPVQGLKRLFSMKSAMEALKAVLKFTFILFIVYWYIKDDLTTFIGFYHLELVGSFLHAKWLIMKLGFSILLGLSIVAAIDFAYQKFSYKKKLMMTKEQAKRDHKEKEGSPEVRQRIRTIQREMANKRMMAEIPNADVIVTNPTHISIVIRYDAEQMISPVVVGKGADHLALRIREMAKKHDIPIVENVLLARTLYKTVKEGQPVPRTLYKAVAEILAFVYKLKRKKKALA
jgi:flagellar biosynthesis protein FlhB